MFCNYCGALLPEKARFCGSCGQPVSGPGIGATPVQPAESSSAPTSSSPGAGFNLDPRDFEHPSMQRMNQLLRNSVILRKTAESLSQKIGKPWYESTFNSIQVTEKQYPRIYELGLIAARRLGATSLPLIYVELDRGYQTATYGSETDAFINIGSFLPRFFNDRELLFIIAHEVGHLISHHALWMTVSLFLVGQQRQNLMSEGIMGFLSNPLKIIEGGVETVITNWMRIADFTADRAALLAAGGFEAAKRALVLLHLKSRRELEEMDIDAWIDSSKPEDLAMSKVSQMLTSATPYLKLRLIELRNFIRTPEYEKLSRLVETESGVNLEGLFDEKGYLKKFAPRPAGSPPPASAPQRQAAPQVKPPAVKTPSPAPSDQSPSKTDKVKILSGKCPKCKDPFVFRLLARPDKPFLDITCKKCGRVFRLRLDSSK